MTNDTANFSSTTYLLEEEMIINGKWEIQNFIAKGGKGEVYLAKQLNLDRQVALKIMSEEFIKSLDGDEEEISSETMRFHREVQVMARMQHPNILQVFDFDQLELNGMKMDYIVMEYIPGLTLRQKMPEKGFGHDESKVRTWLKNYFFPILDGMKAVHDKGVVHRDMKPENVLVDEELPKIMDFGIAGGYHMDNVTRDHHMLGTITYMPEEQFVDLALTDVRVDVYALGKILYEVVEGKMKKGRDKPFHSAALNEPQTIFFKNLDKIIQQATAKNRNQRTPSVKTLHTSLEALVMDFDRGKKLPTDSRYKYWKYLFVISVAVTIIIAGVWITHHNSGKITTSLDGNHIKSQQEVTNPLNLSEFNFKNPRPTSSPNTDKMDKFPAKFLASDDMMMILLKGADVSMFIDDPIVSEGKQVKKTVSVNALYMDKTKITNHLYVQFLNEVDGIEVKGKSVLRNGQLLLLLGEVREGYEPIRYKEGIFRVKSDAVARPVVRVTPVGAMAYARFYGKSLPLMEQWWLAVQTGHDQTSIVDTSPPSQPIKSGWNGMWMMQDQSSGPKPSSNLQEPGIQAVSKTTVNNAGIQGLEQNVNEWTMEFTPDGTPKFHIHGGVGELDHKESYLERQPWEAFSRVGFRTVLNLFGEK
ncbi:MAG: protein kinase [Proteobacteria bacterium]|nr:protein kinase [Pseudomonadota bacterium]MBU1543737.1 protein kinase [Pseudomonadota bacterium]MBU2482988.1 protein kinase [Pseudomonadota bacterium]